MDKKKNNHMHDDPYNNNNKEIMNNKFASVRIYLVSCQVEYFSIIFPIAFTG